MFSRPVLGAMVALVAIATFSAAGHSHAAVDFRVLVQQHVDALNRGDVAAVMATFSDDAVVSNVGLCAASPCVGKPAIQKEMERRVGIHVLFTITSLRESSGKGSGRAEVRADNVRACGQERLVAAFDVEVKGDKITSFPVRFDRSDPQTAAFMACMAARSAGAVTPPNTGDGGLLALAER